MKRSARTERRLRPPSLLSDADVAVTDIRTRTKQRKPDEFDPPPPLELLEELSKDGPVVIETVEVNFEHAPPEGGGRHLIDIYDESDGTQRLFAFSGPWLDILDNDLVVVIDELDRSLLVVATPGAAVPAVRGVSFRLEPGQALGIAGPSASGKSTLARALAGVWPPLRGKATLDGAALEQYGEAQRSCGAPAGGRGAWNRASSRSERHSRTCAIAAG